MPRKPRPWFRFYVEAVRDPKLRLLSPAHRWLWTAVLAAARESVAPGYLLITADLPHDERSLSDFAGMSLRDTREGVRALLRIGVLEEDYERAAWFVPRWNDRQFESDDVTERTAKHRSKERSNDEGRNVPTSSVGTPPEKQRTENREHTRAEQSETATLALIGPTASSASPTVCEFESWWVNYPRKVAKGSALTAFTKARKKKGASLETLEVGLNRSVAQWSHENRPQDKIPHAATWLNDERWNDVYGEPDQASDAFLEPAR